MIQLRLVETFLENYHTFKEAPDIESRNIIMDLEDAIKRAPLSIKEKIVLARLYFTGPKPPERDRPDRNGNTNGRPLGGTTATNVAQELNIDFRRLSEIKQSAIEKIAFQLGEDYGS